MDGFTKLPVAVRAGIIGAIVLALGLIVWMTLLRQPPAVEVFRSKSIEQSDAAKNVFTRKQITYDEAHVGTDFVLTVADKDATDAATALEQNGIKDRTGLAKTKKCPAAPGFTADAAVKTEYRTCTTAKTIQSMLLTSGALAADVNVSVKADDGILGGDDQMSVAAMVFLPQNMRGDTWNAEDAAGFIATAAGTDIENVRISDDRMQALFDGSKQHRGGSSDSGMLGCGDIQDATEIQTKRSAVKNCLDQEISEKLTKLLGSEREFVLSVDPRIDAVARTTTTMRSTKGTVTEHSRQSSGGMKSSDTSTQPSTSQTSAIDPAGDIARLTISVTLDKAKVSIDQEIAVKRMLAGYRDVRRGDPMPVVTRATIAAATPSVASTQELEKLRTDAVGTQVVSDTPAKQARASTPVWALALIAVLAIGIIVTVLILLRRTSQMHAERMRLEQSFQQEQRLFENFAQQNPDQLANDLNALFGAPSAPEPTYPA